LANQWTIFAGYKLFWTPAWTTLTSKEIESSGVPAGKIQP
jgi:hypothetical protein